MNSALQKIFSLLYTPDITQNSDSGASSINGTSELREQIPPLFKKYNINSIFDSGCNDCGWMSRTINSTGINYQGGDISLAMVAHVWRVYPNLNVQVHDGTTDPFPNVDLLFVRDVAIHLNNADKKKLLQNWLDSNIPLILMTHSKSINTNVDFVYSDKFPMAEVNWELPPWNFPPPKEVIWEYGEGGKSMSLWRRKQIAKTLKI